MGRWNNRRWVPRRRYNDEQRRPSPPNYYQTKVDPRDVLENNVLPWEEKFCLLAGIPWHKVVAAKKYIYCYDNVVNWNDSAGKDSLSIAQERFCAMIYGFPCDAPLPDPDIFIDKIDWNPKVDPVLMLDLDKEYFNPDEVDNILCNQTSGENDKNGGSNDNPWESYRLQSTADMKDKAQDWNGWDNHTKFKKIENSWEQGYLPGSGALKDNNWGCFGNESCWNKELNVSTQPYCAKSHCVKLSNQSTQSSKIPREEGWYGGNWNSRHTSFRESRNANNANSWHLQPCGFLKERQRAEAGDASWESKRWATQSNNLEKYDPTRSSRVGGILIGECRKRDGHHEHTARRKSWKHEGHDSGPRQFWEK